MANDKAREIASHIITRCVWTERNAEGQGLIQVDYPAADRIIQHGLDAARAEGRASGLGEWAKAWTERQEMVDHRTKQVNELAEIRRTMRKALQGMVALVERAHRECLDYIVPPPPSVTDNAFISRMIEMFDCQDERDTMTAALAALEGKSDGE